MIQLHHLACHLQELYYTFIPLVNDLKMNGGGSNMPNIGISPAPNTYMPDTFSPQTPASTNPLANGTNVTYSNSTNTTASTNSSINNGSSPPSGGASGAPASWEFLALVYEDVSSFFVGMSYLIRSAEQSVGRTPLIMGPAGFKLV